MNLYIIPNEKIDIATFKNCLRHKLKIITEDLN